MIKSLLIINNHGAVRLSRFYVDHEGKNGEEINEPDLSRRIFSQIRDRADSHCSYLECKFPEYNGDVKLICESRGPGPGGPAAARCRQPPSASR